jgi:hypothetical protein
MLAVGAGALVAGASGIAGTRPKSVLIDIGGFLSPPSVGKVASIPFTGGHATVLAPHAGQPSWNR